MANIWQRKWMWFDPPNLLTNTLAGQVSVPFYQVDWPSPRINIQPQENKGFIHSVSIQLIGKDQFFSAPGQAPTYDYPNPQRPRYPQPTDPVPNLLTTTFTIVAEPFYLTDWPNPLQPRQPQENRGFTHNVCIQLIGKDQFFGAPGQAPVYDYPNPLTPKQPPQAYYQSNLLVGLLAVPFVQVDWPNPLRQRYPLQIDNPPNLVITVVVAAPFAQMDWPLPLQRRYPIQPEPPPNLLTTTTYVVPAPPFYQTNWPLPERARYPIQPEAPPDLLTTTLFVFIPPAVGGVILDVVAFSQYIVDAIRFRRNEVDPVDYP